MPCKMISTPGADGATTSHLHCLFDTPQRSFCRYATPTLQDKTLLELADWNLMGTLHLQTVELTSDKNDPVLKRLL